MFCGTVAVSGRLLFAIARGPQDVFAAGERIRGSRREVRCARPVILRTLTSAFIRPDAHAHGTVSRRCARRTHLWASPTRSWPRLLATFLSHSSRRSALGARRPASPSLARLRGCVCWRRRELGAAHRAMDGLARAGAVDGGSLLGICVLICVFPVHGTAMAMSRRSIELSLHLAMMLMNLPGLPLSACGAWRHRLAVSNKSATAFSIHR
jgi:hypothetical protein